MLYEHKSFEASSKNYSKNTEYKENNWVFM